MPRLHRTLLLALAPALLAAAPAGFEYRLLASARTSTMEREMNQAAADGFRFGGLMGGETGFAGKEVVVVMMKDLDAPAAAPRQYRLLAANKTSTLQNEMDRAGEGGFEYKGQTVFESPFSGREVVSIMERDAGATRTFRYQLLATSRTATMQKELQQAGRDGFRLLGISVGKTSIAGAEVICILGKEGK